MAVGVLIKSAEVIEHFLRGIDPVNRVGDFEFPDLVKGDDKIVLFVFYKKQAARQTGPPALKCRFECCFHLSFAAQLNLRCAFRYEILRPLCKSLRVRFSMKAVPVSSLVPLTTSV